MADPTRTVNDQFLIEIGATADALSPEVRAGAEPPADTALDPMHGLLELNRLFGAWVEQVYHRAGTPRPGRPR